MFPETQLINAKHDATSITGTVAKPSKPSVKFTAFDDPTNTKIQNGIKNQPKLITKFLKNGKYRFSISFETPE